jgi:hypothetical protein
MSAKKWLFTLQDVAKTVGFPDDQKYFGNAGFLISLSTWWLIGGGNFESKGVVEASYHTLARDIVYKEFIIMEVGSNCLKINPN